jgi:hypothetical protein
MLVDFATMSPQEDQSDSSQLAEVDHDLFLGGLPNEVEDNSVVFSD